MQSLKKINAWAQMQDPLSRKFTDLSKNYTLVYIIGIFEALRLLVYKSDPHSKGYNSISILYFP